MNGVLGMAELLMEEELTPEQAEYVSIIKSSGGTLISLINDILDLSKIEAGQVQFENRGFNLIELIEETLAMLRFKIREKGLELVMEIDPALPVHVIGDSLRIKQILVNLLGNAIKFTDTGEIRVKATLDTDQGSHIMICLEVIDSGPGIAEAFMDKIFDSFSQQDSSFTRKYGGTGLGLAITKQLAHLMEGSVHVKNNTTCGARFIVHLRLEKGSGAGQNRGAKRPEAHKKITLATICRQKNIRILVAEDNPVNRKVIELMLKKMQIVPDFVENGTAVLEKMRQSRYDLLLMDVQMPGLNGLEATRMIRDKTSDIAQKDIRIIALTSLAMKSDEKACIDAGMDGYLTKPVQPDKLMQAIAEALEL